MTTVNLSAGFSGVPSSFVYDSMTPTRYTEELSFRTMQFLGALSAAGVRVDVNTETPENLSSATNAYVSEFSTWLSESAAAVSAYLNEEDGGRALPVLATAPALPAILYGAGSLVLVSLSTVLVNNIANIIKVFLQAQADRRMSSLIRLLDGALLDSSWFGLRKESKLDRLIYALDGGTSVGGVVGALLRTFQTEPVMNDEGVYESKTTAELIELLTLKDNALKLLSHIVIDRTGGIEESEFTTLSSILP